MIITCRNCNTSFKLSDDLIKDTGTKVKCSKCKFVFRVFPPHIEKESETPETDETVKHSETENRRSGEAVSEKTADRDFPVAEESRPENREDFGSPVAMAVPSGEKEKLAVEEPDAAAADTGEKKEKGEEYEDFDLSELDDFFDQKEEFEDVEEKIEKPDEFDESSEPSDEADDLDREISISDEDADSDSGADFDDDLANFQSVPEQLDDISIDELSLGDEDEDEEGEIAGSQGPGETGSSDLDFDFDLELEGDEKGSAEAATEGSEAGDELDFDFDLELEGDEKGSAEAATEGSEVGDELDFDFDLELEGDEKDSAEAATEGSEAGDGLDFDFDLELEGDEKGSAEAATEGSEVGDELDFDSGLELEGDEKGSAEAATEGSEAGDGLALELELESDEKVADEKSSEKFEEGDFDFKEDEKEEGEKSERGEPEVEPEEEEFDLSDLDRMIDLEEQAQAAHEEEKSQAGAKTAAMEDDSELDFELEEDDDSGEPKVNVDGEEFEVKDPDDAMEVNVERSDDDEDFKLDFDIDKVPEETAIAEEGDFRSEEDEEKVQKVFDTITLAGKSDTDDEDDLEEPALSKPKNKVGKVLILALVLVLAGVGGYFGYGLIEDAGIDIPFIGSGQSEIPDPGNLNITAFDLDSKFVANETAGKLFVITGRVKNEYTDPRSFVRISGQLFQPGKKLAQTEVVYAGNAISEMELEILDAETIKNRLNNRFGQNNANANIKPGQAVPFMIVFFNLPEQLEEYAVSVESSSPGQN